jgi:hypothetical protein
LPQESSLLTIGDPETSSQLLTLPVVEKGGSATSQSDSFDDGSTAKVGDGQEGRQHFAGNDQESATRADDFDAPQPGPTFAALLDQDDIEPVPMAGKQGPFTAAVDQTPILVAPQHPVSDATAEQVKTIVADAVEGRTVDLDALLGDAGAPDHPLPLIQLQASGESGFLSESGMLSMGNLFMPDMAEQHVMAQMEHAAATGHV